MSLSTFSRPRLGLAALGFFLALVVPALLLAQTEYPPETRAIPIPKIDDLPLIDGPFKGTIESLKQYQCPAWFRDAKFGIWSHWGPQAVPGDGDWYARNMYMEGNGDYIDHVKVYGHPTKMGYKDIIPLWHAEKWDPDRLMSLYKAAGAHYFVAQGVHHDNFDNWTSKYHKWNSVNMGPHKDMVGLWQKAALRDGLHFGVSEHLGASFTWFQGSHGSDTKGPFAGMPYDGANPAFWDLYHMPAQPGDTAWYSNNPVWMQEWYARIYDLITTYKPDLLYSDGGYPFQDVGLKLIAEFYNDSLRNHNGKLEAVYNCKDMGNGSFAPGMNVEDVERGGKNEIQPFPWQTDTSTGDWFYRKGDSFKKSEAVIHTLTDIVSKNGNLLLNVVQYPDGSLPPEMETFLSEMADWMKINGDAIFGTRPWTIYGEGPTTAKQGAFNDNISFSPRDIRFTRKGSDLYLTTLGLPTSGLVVIHSLAADSPLVSGQITRVTLLGSTDPVSYTRTADGLAIQLPATLPCKAALCFKVSGLTTVANLTPDALSAFTARLREEELPHSGPDGVIDLAASDAQLQGSMIRVVASNNPPNIGWWSNPDEYASWTFKVTSPGTYAVSIDMGSSDDNSAFLLQAGSETLETKSANTGGWDNYQVTAVGNLKIDTAGVVTLTMKPKSASAWQPFNVRSIQLKPATSLK